MCTRAVDRARRHVRISDRRFRGMIHLCTANWGVLIGRNRSPEIDGDFPGAYGRRVQHLWFRNMRIESEGRFPGCSKSHGLRTCFFAFSRGRLAFSLTESFIDEIAAGTAIWTLCSSSGLPEERCAYDGGLRDGDGKKPAGCTVFAAPASGGTSPGTRRRCYQRRRQIPAVCS